MAKRTSAKAKQSNGSAQDGSAANATRSEENEYLAKLRTANEIKKLITPLKAPTDYANYKENLTQYLELARMAYVLSYTSEHQVPAGLTQRDVESDITLVKNIISSTIHPKFAHLAPSRLLPSSMILTLDNAFANKEKLKLRLSRLTKGLTLSSLTANGVNQLEHKADQVAHLHDTLGHPIDVNDFVLIIRDNIPRDLLSLKTHITKNYNFLGDMFDELRFAVSCVNVTSSDQPTSIVAKAITQPPFCTNCNKKGHTNKQCWASPRKKQRLRPNGSYRQRKRNQPGYRGKRIHTEPKVLPPTDQHQDESFTDADSCI